MTCESASAFKLRKRTRMCKLQVTSQDLLRGRKRSGIVPDAEIGSRFSTLQEIELFFCRAILIGRVFNSDWEWSANSFSVASDTFANSIREVCPFLE
jgi:hypothetical protein